MKRIVLSVGVYLLITAPSLLAQVVPTQILNDTRSFEVSACNPSKKEIISVWMEKRPERKDNSADATDMRVAYKSSANNGKDWTEKGIVDLPATFATGNPVVASNDRGEAYLVCMHIGMDFYSGNISLYEFDKGKKQFSLKSIPIKSDSKLLDKPAIVCVGNEIHLVYNAYSKRAKNSIQYQMSPDKGKTWTKAVDVFHEENVSYLGPSITVSDKKQVLVATGSYGSKNIYLAKKQNGSLAFEAATVVAKVTNNLGAAMTELSAYKQGLILTWQNPHQRGETYLSYSKDEGISWAKPLLVTSFGNLSSAAFDEKGNIHCIYSDFSNQKFFVGYKLFDSEFKVLKQKNITSPTPQSTFTEYLGAYQKLLIQGKELFAFWIDYPNHNILKFTKWKM